MASWRTPAFNKCYAKLDASVQTIVDEAYEQYKRNPSLVNYGAKGREGNKLVCGARITQFWRALAFEEDGNTYWFWVGTHTDYDRIIGRLSK